MFLRIATTLFFISLLSCRQTNRTPSISLPGVKDDASTLLPNGWTLTPAGRTVPLGDLPLNIMLSPDQQYLVATNNGYSPPSLTLVSLQSEEVVQTLRLPDAWLGLAWSSDGKTLYCSGGHRNRIYVCNFSNGKLSLSDSILLGKPWPEKISITGIALSDDNRMLYAVTKENNRFYAIDLSSKKMIRQIPLPAESYTCLSAKDGSKVFISLWGKNEVLMYDVASKKITDTIPVGNHPNAMACTKDGKVLYVSNAGDNTVHIINLANMKDETIINVAVHSTALAGSTPNALCLAAEDSMLLVANADNNCLVALDVHDPLHPVSKGFIPTGWYPTSVAANGGKIFVANGKGNQSYANPGGPVPGMPDTVPDVQYIGGLLTGTLSVIDFPSATELKNYTGQVLRNTPFQNADSANMVAWTKENPIPRKPGDASAIKHVFYIIKENRTYDQVLGDVKEGNGDTTLCLFPRQITPNQHAIAQQFVLLDNFYVNAEVSADGHNWSTAAYATDYIEKTWPELYGGRGGTYDYEGLREIAKPENGYIWDYCRRNNTTYRSYGEFANLGKAAIPALDNHIPKDYPDFDMHIADTTRMRIWQHDFDSLLANNAVPQFQTIRFSSDHTSGAHGGMPIPQSAVADNDLAVGKFIDHLSHSSIWNESVVFIVEDDAQDGPDHVDAHRCTAYVAGGMVKRNLVDHTMYSTASMLHTIELILGLPPMSQYDASATPMWRCFMQQPDNTPFEFVPNKFPLDSLNPSGTGLAAISSAIDLSSEDRVPDHLFSSIIWKTVKGENAPVPAVRHAAFVFYEENGEAD